MALRHLDIPGIESADRILIVTVTKVEGQAILETFSHASGEVWARYRIGDKTYYSLGIHGDAPIFMVQSEMGSVMPGGSLLTVHQAILDLRPQAVIMCGIAFGLHPGKQKLGDILIAKQILSYEAQKVDLQRSPILRSDRVTASERLLDRFHSGDIDWKGAQTHFGLVLSGEKLVNAPDSIDWFLEIEPEALGGEMEGAGLYVAARKKKVDWILVKAICDWADGNKNNNAQSLAARNAAQFILHVLRLGGWENPEQIELSNSSSFQGMSSKNNPVSFKSQLGVPRKTEFLEHEERWHQYARKGENPYVILRALSGNSPVFYGRENVLRDVCKDSHGSLNISILGERHIGKTSLLNQVYEELSTIDRLVTLYGDAQAWQQCTEEDFFEGVFQSICEVLPPPNHNESNVSGYRVFREFIEHCFINDGYRFVLIIDEFEAMVKNKNLGAGFFSNLRSLGNGNDCRLSYLISSRKKLADLHIKEKHEPSPFHSLFARSQVLGLLSDTEADLLIQQPLQKSLGCSIKNPHAILQLTDRHPALIQLVMRAFWEGWHNPPHISFDDKTIEDDLKNCFEDILSCHEAENEFLINVVKGIIDKNVEYNSLSRRGLITSENYLFSREFHEQVLKNLPNEKNLKRIVSKLELAEELRKAFLGEQ